MRVQPLSNAERTFILQSFVENLRVDGRRSDQFRRLRLLLGSTPGACLAVCGNTKVMARVSCALKQPSVGRPNEGDVYVNVEMSPMAAPNHEAGRLGSRGLEVTRMLERLLREAACVDKESLCLKAGEQVWEIRVDVHVLDHDGGLLDCASTAAITALAHFRRPDCSVQGRTVTVHSAEERDMIPLNLYHLPVCVTYGLTENGDCVIADPTEREELCLQGTIVVGANKRQEVCALHCSGSVILKKALILKCVSKAIERVTDLSEQIRSVITDDREKRARGEQRGFVDLISLETLTGNEFEENKLFAAVVPSTSLRDSDRAHIDHQPPPIVVRKSVLQLGAREQSMMTERPESDEDEMMAQIAEGVALQTLADSTEAAKRRKIEVPTRRDSVDSLLGDIEEDVMILNPEDLGYEKKEPILIDLADDADDITDVNLTSALKPKGNKKKKR